MKKAFLFIVTVCVVGAALYLGFMGKQYYSQKEVNYAEVTAAAQEFTGQIGQLVKNVDSDTANAVLDFAKEKVDSGALKSADGLNQAIAEGKEKFGVELQVEDAQKIVDTVEQLESLGLSADTIVDEAQKLYDEYGADCVEHVQDAVSNVVKEAATNVASDFADYVKESVTDTVQNAFSGT